MTPDFVGKIAFEPGWGHWEVFGIERNFRARIYPNEGAATPSSAGAYNDAIPGAGIGGGFRAPLGAQDGTIGLKGLWGKGVGRYGSSTIADITLRPDATDRSVEGLLRAQHARNQPQPVALRSTSTTAATTSTATTLARKATARL